MKIVRLAVALSLVLASTHALATVPSSFTVQGVLRDGMGALASHSVGVTVKLWRSQSGMAGSDQLFVSPSTSVGAVNGLFTVPVTLSPADVKAIGDPAVTELWLEVTADGFVYSRQPVSAGMYSIFSSQADSLSVNCQGCVADAMIGSVSGSKVQGQVSDSAALGGIPAANWYPAFAAVTRPTNGTPLTLNASMVNDVPNYAATVTPRGPKGLFLVSLSGQFIQQGGAVSLALIDRTTKATSGQITTNGGSNGNTFSDSASGYLGMSLYWIEPASDTMAHTFGIVSSNSSTTTSSTLYGDLNVVWLPQP
jgi:hypothetical protein